METTPGLVAEFVVALVFTGNFHVLNLKLIGCFLDASQCSGPKGDRDERPLRGRASTDKLVSRAQNRRGCEDTDEGHLIRTVGWKASQRRCPRLSCKTEGHRPESRQEAWLVQHGGEDAGRPTECIWFPQVGKSGLWAGVGREEAEAETGSQRDSRGTRTSS